MRGARAGFVFWLMTAAVAHAQDVSVFPNKPIRFVVPFQPGGGTELVVFDRKGTAWKSKPATKTRSSLSCTACPSTSPWSATARSS